MIESGLSAVSCVCCDEMKHQSDNCVIQPNTFVQSAVPVGIDFRREKSFRFLLLLRGMFFSCVDSCCHILMMQGLNILFVIIDFKMTVALNGSKEFAQEFVDVSQHGT